MQKISQQNDALLLQYLRAEESAESETLLSQLIAEHAEPIIGSIIRSTLHVSLGSKDGSYKNQNALELAGDVRALLVAEVSAFKNNSDVKLIGNFRSYVAVTTYHACYEYLRREHPQRAQLKGSGANSRDRARECLIALTLIQRALHPTCPALAPLLSLSLLKCRTVPS
jgi:hypothetical protein